MILRIPVPKKVLRPCVHCSMTSRKTVYAGALTNDYMFGPDYLVAPVDSAGESERNVYLPTGEKWTDAWNAEAFEGGQTVVAEDPPDRIPFVRQRRWEEPC